ncbi:MAG: hypothetical protein KAX37_10530 [Opitutaceae bacterium]|nr:hypothetical protein [Opitutaceae bacterium]
MKFIPIRKKLIERALPLMAIYEAGAHEKRPGKWAHSRASTAVDPSAACGCAYG